MLILNIFDFDNLMVFNIRYQNIFYAFKIMVIIGSTVRNAMTILMYTISYGLIRASAHTYLCLTGNHNYLQ